jgi:hypothetical protein
MNADINEKYLTWRKAENNAARARAAWRNRQVTREQLDAAARLASDAFRALPGEFQDTCKVGHKDDTRWRKSI